MSDGSDLKEVFSSPAAMMLAMLFMAIASITTAMWSQNNLHESMESLSAEVRTMNATVEALRIQRDHSDSRIEDHAKEIREIQLNLHKMEIQLAGGSHCPPPSSSEQ